jgi:phosphate transport system permease protein
LAVSGADARNPVGEGGGIGNAIVGSLILLGLACCVGIPLGIIIGTYLAEMGDGWFGRLFGSSPTQ